jgi:hypothetical protein
MTTHPLHRAQLRGALYRLAALGALLLPVVLAACKGDGSGGGAGY